MELLKLEIQTINDLVARMDTMAQTTKNWAISIWTRSIAITLSQPELRKFVILSAVTPILFWYIDASFRRIQARSIYRAQKIREFLKSDNLVSSYKNYELVDFVVFDTTGTQYKGSEGYEKFASVQRTLGFPEVQNFSLVLMVISLGMGLFFLLNP